jgi:hypothetical protein
MEDIFEPDDEDEPSPPLPEAGSSKKEISKEVFDATKKEALDKTKKAWIDKAETFIAMRLVGYLSQFSLQMTYQIRFLVVGSFLFFMAVIIYPFQPQRLLTGLASILAVGVAALVWLFFFRMDRNELIQRIGKRKGGWLSFDFTFFRTVVPYLAPLLTLLIAQVPGMRDLLSSWLEPLFRVMR